MNIDPETGNTASTSGRSPRFSLWVAFLLFSTITMWSAVSEKRARDDTDSNAKWAVTSSAITFSITAVVVVMHLSPMLSTLIVNTRIEGALTLILAIFWAATVAVVSNASSGLAVDSDLANTIVNGNLYYFSWAGFVTSVLLLVAYLREVFGVDVAGEIQTRAARLTVWSALLACQLVVLGSSASMFDHDCPLENSESYCHRTKFGIALGVIGTVFALGVVSMKMITAIAPFVVEGILAIFLCIMNLFGVGYLTSAKGPGSQINNLYYFSWISLVLCVQLVANIYEEYTGIGTDSTSASRPEESSNDIPVETIEEGL
eukprot:Nitzschia sp. Nitz4//scaffold424_size9595//8254//9407//NITZ4_009093-RA/size9595-augustus-gene-0.11-mRNA-1//1//CDS//3329551598//3910//frame0